VHADDWHGLHAGGALDVFQVDHRDTAVRIAFAARLHASLAADAAIRIDEELKVLRLHVGYCCGSSFPT
jgi:hypothetical protein